MSINHNRMKKAIALFALIAALLSSGACKTQQKNVKDITAKTSDTTSVSEVSKSESSVWHPSSVSVISEGPSSDASDTQSSVVSQTSIDPMYNVPAEYCDNGIFSAYYEDAYRYLSSMTLDEKIGQMLIAGLPYEDEIEIIDEMIRKKQKELLDSGRDEAKIEAIGCIAVDEEGGTVSRISSNKELTPHEFKSPRELYKSGGMAYIQSDADEKATLLHELGIDVNLAPVCDISTNKSDFMYSRSLGEDAKTTADYVRIVTELSQKRGVSVTLKHFPGYGSNSDTHTGSSVDSRTIDDLKKNDLIPFEAGIKAGAHLVMVSHNTVNCIDENNPASLSPDVHKLLRKDMGFTGLIITDDLSMGAISNYKGEETPVVAAVIAGNDLLIINSSMIESSISSIKAAIESGKITEDMINRAAFRIIAWKYARGMM